MAFVKRIFVAAMMMTAAVEAAPQSPAASLDWPQITSEQRPWAFNWWLGSAVQPDFLNRELQRYADAGLGGIHVIPIYGAKGAESRYLKYLSPEWMHAFRHAVGEAGSHGMGVDLTTGTGWCFGGPSISAELGGRKLLAKVMPFPKDGKWPRGIDRAKTTLQFLVAVGPDGGRKDVLPLLDSSGTFSWRPPADGWQLQILGHQSTGQKVKRPSPGGEGLMINPFDPRAMRAFLDQHSAAFDQPGVAKPRAMYHDSYEYYAANWVDSLPAEFARRRGYRIEGEIPALAGEGDPDRVARVRCDYRETLSDLLVEDVFPLWADWCRKRGMKTRNQAHGAPANLLDFYNVADIPETEMFGHGGPDPLVSKFDQHIGGADRNPLISKFASSAAHTAGKPLVSAETGTWLAEHFCESWAEMKGLVDQMFVSGVNHIIYHGCVYSPDDAAWPGWLFYAATQMNPRNPLWREVRTLNDYIARCQSVLQSGRPDHDVLLYWPIHDLFAAGTSFQFTVHDHAWLSSEPVGRAARTLWDRGYGFDYVSDRLLAAMKFTSGRMTGPGGNVWRVILVPETRTMPESTLHTLLHLAHQGASVVFLGGLPQDVPGLGNLESRRHLLQKTAAELTFESAGHGVRVARTGAGRVLVGPLAEALSAAGICRETMMDIPGLKFIRRSHPDGKHHFITNHAVTAFDGWLPLANPAATVVAMNPMTGLLGRLPCRPSASGGIEVELRLEPGHSIILRSFEQPVENVATYLQDRPGREIQRIATPWHVDFLEGGPVLPSAFESPAAVPWTGRGDASADAFSGTARYRTTFDLDPGALRSGQEVQQLDLGEVSQVAKIRLNDHDLGSCIMPPFRMPLPAGLLRPTGNRLEIEITNTGANRLRDLDLRKVPWRIFHDINLVSITYKPMDAAKWPVQTSGLSGPVRILAQTSIAQPQ